MSAIERPPAAVLPLYEPAKIPPGAPSKVDPPPGADLITVNFGPNHPSTHGVLRLIVTLDGEVVWASTPTSATSRRLRENFERRRAEGIPMRPGWTTSRSSPTSWRTWGRSSG
jgi:hypothetical protein